MACFFACKKVAKNIFLPPLTACFLHDSKSAPTGKCSRGFEPPLGAVAKASGGNPVGRIDLLQRAVGEFAKGCIALSIAEGLKTAKKQVYIFGKRTTEKMHGQKTALGLA